MDDKTALAIVALLMDKKLNYNICWDMGYPEITVQAAPLALKWSYIHIDQDTIALWSVEETTKHFDAVYNYHWD